MGEPVRETGVMASLLRELLDELDDILYVLDGDGETVFWNERLAETTGYTNEEIASMPPKELLRPEEREQTPGLGEAIDTLGDSRIVLDIVTKDGTAIPHEFRGTTVENAETGDVYRCGLARDVSDRIERQRELERYERIVETVSDGVYALDETLSFEFVNDGLCELFDTAREELLGADPREMFVEDTQRELAAELREQVVSGDGRVGTLEGRIERRDGSVRELEARYRLQREPVDGEFPGSVGVIRDVTERNRRERELARQRDELATLNRINELLLDITRELVATPNRRAVERTVCERLAGSDLYRFAWIGDHERADDRIVPRVSAGEDDGYVASVALDGDAATPAGSGPGGEALRTGSVQVVTVDDPGFAPWRDAAAARGVESVAAVPLRHGDTVYGMLAVYATRADAFSEREQAGFSVLGETVGFVINAIKHRNLMFADAITELEFRVADADSLLVSTAAALDCTLVLDGYVSTDDGWLVYVDIEDAEPGAVAERLTTEPAVRDVRVISDVGEHRRVEVTVNDAPLLDTVSAVGGTVKRASSSAEARRVVVEIPSTADSREAVEGITGTLPASTLVAQRERDRRPTHPSKPDGLLADLTSRQRDALAVAYRAGYFEWPRESTAEEIAETLGVASSTLHAHLRKAERQLLDALLDEE